MVGRPRFSRRAGFTLLEISIAVGLLSVIGIKLVQVLSSASRYSSTENSSFILEERATAVLDRIVYAIMSTNRETLLPEAAEPLHSESLHYQIKLGVEDGEVVWDDPEMIGVDQNPNQMIWARNPGAETERRLVWCNLVAPFLEGEIPNGKDDNGNGIVDESGLSFTVVHNKVTIRLTLERRGSDGTLHTKYIETNATCRNLGINP